MLELDALYVPKVPWMLQLDGESMAQGVCSFGRPPQPYSLRNAFTLAITERIPEISVVPYSIHQLGQFFMIFVTFKDSGRHL